MAEYEELKLSVVLDDQATAKLEQLKKNASGVEGHTKQVEGYNKALGQTVETGKNLQVVNEGIRERALGAAEGLVGIHEGFLKASISGRGLVGVLATVNRNVENMGANFGKVGLAVGGVAIGMVAAIAIGERFAKMLSNYAQTSVQRQRAAATIGIPSAQLKLYEQAYELHGFTKEQAHEDVTAAAEKAHELRRSGWNEFRAELTKGQPTPERMQAANEGVARLTEAARLGTPAYIRQSVAEAQGAGEQRRRELAGSRLSPEAIEEEVATAVTKMMVVLTGSTRFGQIGNVGTASKEDIERQKTADEQAQKHFLAMQKIWVAYGTATDKLSESLTGVALKVLGPISEKFGTWADSLKPEDFQKFADTLNQAVEYIAAIDWKPIINDLSGIVHGIGQVFTTGQTMAMNLRWATTLGIRQKRAQDQPLTDEERQELETQDAYFEEQKKEAQRQKDLKTMPGMAAAIAGGPSRDAMTRVAGERGVDEPAPGFNYGSISSADPLKRGAAWLLHGISHPFKDQSEIFEDQAEKTRLLEQTEATRTGESVFATQQVRPTIPAMSQQAPVGLGYTPPPGEPTFATYDRQSTALDQNTEQLKSLNDTLKNPNAMAAALGYSDIRAEAPDLGEQTQRIQKRLGWMFPQQTDGATFDERFGPTSPPPPQVYPQKSSWRDDTAPIPTETIDRAALYSAARNDVTHKVEGTGTLTVDVNAPQGTQVDAEAGGIFAKLEINRQMQMERSASSLRRPDIFGPI